MYGQGKKDRNGENNPSLSGKTIEHKKEVSAIKIEHNVSSKPFDRAIQQ